ncbi:hypothetical protein RclHR1_00160040 [Rhizophagus clarus]|uniref:Uncharacterized protein n=1 Tax=Rhizophagus clarus TaxID=94130 RepID=A0A2Z6QVQ8_9GLOM|nr:hypothetical protein RclHR1_00160040 [Rhizophagus clarus]
MEILAKWSYRSPSVTPFIEYKKICLLLNIVHSVAKFWISIASEDRVDHYGSEDVPDNLCTTLYNKTLHIEISLANSHRK